MSWRERLREAIDSSDRKHGAVAFDARIVPATLSNVLTGASPNPRFETVVGIAHAVGVSLGWLLGEEGFGLTPEQTAEVLAAAQILLNFGREDSVRKK